jgi:hypothetical protein
METTTAALARIVLTGLLLSFGAACFAQPQESAANISLSVRPEWTTDGKLSLIVRLTNESSGPLEFPLGLGPWVGPSTIRLVGIEVWSGQPIISRGSAFLDPQILDVKLKPGESRDGKVVLDDVYPEFAGEMKKHGHRRELVLFWTYQLELDDGSLSNRVGGWIDFPPGAYGKVDQRGK